MNNFFKFTLLTITIVTFSFESNSQVQNVLDGAYIKELNLTKRVIPYPHLREADVMYVTRIWQKMDLKQKINQPFYYPVQPIKDRKSLFDVIRQGLLADDPTLIAYDPGPNNDDDEFRIEFSRDEIYDILNPIDSSMKQNEYGEDIGYETIQQRIGSDQITQYLLKEDWIWDRQRSERYVRIIGIAPLIEGRNDRGDLLGTRPLFWLYYENCRYVFANAEAFNLLNDAQRRTYEDLFQMRYFSSYIVKESNVYDREMINYVKGMDALAESERIKEELFILEHDLWHY